MFEKNSGGGQPDKKSGWALCRLLREGFWRLNLMLVYGRGGCEGDLCCVDFSLAEEAVDGSKTWGQRGGQIRVGGAPELIPTPPLNTLLFPDIGAPGPEGWTD